MDKILKKQSFIKQKLELALFNNIEIGLHAF